MTGDHAPVPPIPARPAVLDLTHTLAEGIPVWPGDPEFTMHRAVDRPAFLVNALHLGEHTGTHVDAPLHAVPGGLGVDRIPSADLIAPLVVIDFTRQSAHDPDAVLTVDDVTAWEVRHGRIPARALVALHTGLDEAFEDAAAFLGTESGTPGHFPGYSGEAAEFLVRHREVAAIGTDALSIDAGGSPDLPAHLAVLGAGRYAVEMLARLGEAPATGATVLVAPLKIRDGSGAPARVLALLP